MKLTIQHGESAVRFNDPTASSDDLERIVKALMRALPPSAGDAFMASTVERAEPYYRPDHEDDGPIGFRPMVFRGFAG